MPRGLLLASGLCAAALFLRLGQPALWQDEAETALLGASVLAHGYPSVRLNGSLITVEPTLAARESNAQGAWIWNTWLPYYLAAGSFALFGQNAWAARLPFALAALLAYAGMLLLVPKSVRTLASFWLALCVPWLLFMRQCRYYSLVCLGTVVAVHSYKRMLEKRRGAAVGLAASLLFLLNSSFVYCPLVLAALAADASLRRGEGAFARRFWACAAAVAVLALPEAIYFKVWSRPGNHAYPALESLAFLRTFFLWLAAFAAPVPAFLAAGKAAPKILLAYLALLWLLLREGPLADLAAAAALALLIFVAMRAPVDKGVLSLRRLTLILCAVSLLVFSWAGAEPYGRYLAFLLPFIACAAAEWTRSRWAAALCLSSNLAFILPARALSAFAPAAPAESVSGMMRQRLREVRLRSDLFLFASELWRGPHGYVEPIAGRLLSSGRSFFSDSDAMSLLFATGLKPLAPEDLGREAPDWIVPSPWLSLAPDTQQRLQSLLSRFPYEQTSVAAPERLWQNNPDILVHSFDSPMAERTLFRLRTP